MIQGGHNKKIYHEGDLNLYFSRLKNDALPLSFTSLK